MAFYRVSVNPLTKMLVLTFTDTTGASVKTATGDFIIWAACRNGGQPVRKTWKCATSGGRFHD